MSNYNFYNQELQKNKLLHDFLDHILDVRNVEKNHQSRILVEEFINKITIEGEKSNLTIDNFETFEEYQKKVLEVLFKYKIEFEMELLKLKKKSN